MIDLPFNPGEILAGDTMLARYLRADPARVAVLQTICENLDDDGRVGDRARYYVVRNPLRRTVLRGTLIALGIPLPSWAHCNPAAESANEAFINSYRQAHNERQLGWTSTMPPSHPAHTRKLFSATENTGLHIKEISN